jgi:hypothetical protein
MEGQRCNRKSFKSIYYRSMPGSRDIRVTKAPPLDRFVSRIAQLPRITATPKLTICRFRTCHIGVRQRSHMYMLSMPNRHRRLRLRH